MTLREKVWIALLAVAVSLTFAAGYTPYFPGDVALTRLVQSLAPASTGWAQWISSTGKFPWCLLLLAMTVVLASRIAGVRGALLSLASFTGMELLGRYLGPLVARPRPTPDLVRVAQQLSGIFVPLRPCPGLRLHRRFPGGVVCRQDVGAATTGRSYYERGGAVNGICGAPGPGGALAQRLAAVFPDRSPLGRFSHPLRLTKSLNRRGKRRRGGKGERGRWG